MQRFCLQCKKSLPENAHKQRKFCDGKCQGQFWKDKYLQNNPFTSTTSATTGAISELRVAVDLLSKGYNVFRALSPSCPCDLAVLKDNKLSRIEVRTTHISFSGKPYKTKDKRDDPNNIDIYAWVLPNEILYEPPLDG